jgi:hypothetical protein
MVSALRRRPAHTGPAVVRLVVRSGDLDRCVAYPELDDDWVIAEPLDLVGRAGRCSLRPLAATKALRNKSGALRFTQRLRASTKGQEYDDNDQIDTEHGEQRNQHPYLRSKARRASQTTMTHAHERSVRPGTRDPSSPRSDDGAGELRHGRPLGIPSPDGEPRVGIVEGLLR